MPLRLKEGEKEAEREGGEERERRVEREGDRERREARESSVTDTVNKLNQNLF